MTTTGSTPLRFTGAATTHVGLVRGHNEDSGFAGPGLLLVADGVGGHAAGEVASSIAAHVVSSVAGRRRERPLLATLREAVALAQQHVADAVTPDRTGMATTLTVVVGDGRRFALAQLGDSRAYLLRDGVLSRLSRDHTVVQQLLDDGTLTPDEARRHPWRHVVTRVLRGEPSECGDLVELELRVGDRLLLCSDGLSDLVADADIAEVLRSGSDQQAVEALVDEALRAGGRDNVTVIVATLEPGLPAEGGSLVGAAASQPWETSRSA